MKTPPTITSGRKRRFAEKLLRWYSSHKRTLPWRTTRNPYRILVSELMLQQTQVERVLGRYQQWLKRFPTLKSLADAPRSAVLSEWQGLGYNRRAVYLHTIAQQLCDTNRCRFPDTIKDLQALPGVGRYTAHAIMSFAFEKPVPVVDTNVVRVHGRIFLGYKQMNGVTEEQQWKLASQLVPLQHSHDYNQALMDVGSLVCTQRSPRCTRCPMKRMCASYPEIAKESPAALVARRPAEPLYFGRPRRIWRGRILSYLNRQTEGATVEQIGSAVFPRYQKQQHGWLLETLQRMQNDGLVVIQNDAVSLPT